MIEDSFGKIAEVDDLMIYAPLSGGLLYGKIVEILGPRKVKVEKFHHVQKETQYNKPRKIVIWEPWGWNFVLVKSVKEL